MEVNNTLTKDILDIQKEVSKDIINWEKDKKVKGASADPFDYFSKEYLWNKIAPMLQKKDIIAIFSDEKGNSSAGIEKRDNVVGGYGKPFQVIGQKPIFYVGGWRKLTLIKGDEQKEFFFYAVGDDNKSFNFAVGKRATYGDRYLLIGVFGCVVSEKTAEEYHFNKVEKNKEGGVENNNGEQQQTRDDEGISW